MNTQNADPETGALVLLEAARHALIDRVGLSEQRAFEIFAAHALLVVRESLGGDAETLARWLEAEAAVIRAMDSQQHGNA